MPVAAENFQRCSGRHCQEDAQQSEQIAADGETPWCIGLASGGATGWPATDWVKDLMLRLNTPEDYDAWTTSRIHRWRR